MPLPLQNDFIFLLQGRILFIKNKKQTVATIEHHYIIVFVWLLESDKLQSLQGTGNSSYSNNSGCFSSSWL